MRFAHREVRGGLVVRMLRGDIFAREPYRPGQGFASDSLADEYVAMFWNRLDVARVRGIISQQSANVFDALSQSRVRYEDPVPDKIEDTLLFNQPPALAHEKQ